MSVEQEKEAFATKGKELKNELERTNKVVQDLTGKMEVLDEMRLKNNEKDRKIAEMEHIIHSEQSINKKLKEQAKVLP